MCTARAAQCPALGGMCRSRDPGEVHGMCRPVRGTGRHMPCTDQDRAGVILAMTSVASVHEMIESAQNASTNRNGIRMKLPITP
ncbi:MAG: hypothetical protein RL325_1416 [Planctomycetota bacterium]|jgi:hypothetical protein